LLTKIKLSTVLCGGFILVSLIYFNTAMHLVYWSNKYAPGAGFVPRWASGAMLILSIVAFIQSFKEKGIALVDVLPPERVGQINLYVCWGGLLFFLFTVRKIGFVIAAWILLTSLFSRGTSWKKAVLFGFVVTMCCFFIFKVLLQVQVPVNKFGF
jgi:hypothetical protein